MHRELPDIGRQNKIKFILVRLDSDLFCGEIHQERGRLSHRYLRAGSILQIEPEYFGAITMIAPAKHLICSLQPQKNILTKIIYIFTIKNNLKGKGKQKDEQ